MVSLFSSSYLTNNGEQVLNSYLAAVHGSTQNAVKRAFNEKDVVKTNHTSK